MPRNRVRQPRPVEEVLPRSIGPIKEPNKNDVLCGRGSKSTYNPGNIQYREIVNHAKLEYVSEQKKLQKKFVAAEIVQQIRSMNPPGRFLKEDFKGGPYYEIGDKEAFNKVLQALREKAPELREQMMEWKNAGERKKSEGATVIAAKLNGGPVTKASQDGKPKTTKAVADKKPSAKNAKMEGRQSGSLNGKVEGQNKKQNNAANKDPKKQRRNTLIKTLIGGGSKKRVANDPSAHRGTLPCATQSTKNKLQNNGSARCSKLERFSQMPQQQSPLNTETHNGSVNGNFAWQYLVETPKNDGKEIGWHFFDNKTSDGLEKEFQRGRTFCQTPSERDTYETNFGSMQQRNLTSGESRSVRRWYKNSQSPCYNKAANDQRFPGALPGGKKYCQHSEMASQLMSQYKPMAIDIAFHQFDGVFSETSSITAASLLSGPSTDSRRRGAAAVMQDDPNEPLPIQQHPAVDRSCTAAQQQLPVPTTTQQQATAENLTRTQKDTITAQDGMAFHSSNSKTWLHDDPNEPLPIQQHSAIVRNPVAVAQQPQHVPTTTPRQMTAPDDLMHTREDMVTTAQDEMTFDSGNSKTWCKIGHGFISQEDMTDARDEMTLDSFNSQIWGDTDHNPTHKEATAPDNFIPAAQDDVTLDSINSRIWGDQDSIASQHQQAVLTSQKVAPNDLISIPEDIVAAQNEMATGRVKARMWDMHVEPETLCSPGYGFIDNCKDGDASLCSAMSVSVLSSRMGTISIASSHASFSTGSGSVPVM